MLELRRSRDRGYDDHGWLKTYYTFSFADYYDPEHVDFGPLKVMNEERIRPGKGYQQQRQDTEVLTYLIEGELRHRDSLGNEVILSAGGLQCLSAGAGLSHSETNSSASQEAHLLHAQAFFRRGEARPTVLARLAGRCPRVGHSSPGRAALWWPVSRGTASGI